MSSTAESPGHPLFQGQGRQLAALLLLVLVSAGISLANGFAYDDVPLILENTRVHAGSPFWVYLGQGYWPSHGDALYRPVTIWLFGLQWALGAGAPWLFHAVSIALYATTVMVLFMFAGYLLPTWAAWLAAALFAVHPVHVEVVGNVVGQSELHVGLATAGAMLIYARARRAGVVGPRTRILIALLALWAALAKEHGLLLPVSLVWLEIAMPSDSGPLPTRLRRNASLWTLLGVTMAAVLALRWTVVGGLENGVPAIALEGASFSERVLTMLGVVPHWLRLLVWPSTLMADYSPPAFDRVEAFGVPQAAGVLILLATAYLIWRTWNRRPAAAFGIGLVVLWLLPVSNVLVPTGILLAERSLYLPSMGLVIAVGAAAVPLRAARPIIRFAVGAALVFLLTAGTTASVRRYPVWHDNDRLFRQTLQDAPDQYRSHWMWARHLEAAGRVDEAVAALRIAADLYDRDPVVFEDLGHLQRLRGRCEWAIEPLRHALELDSSRVIARGRLTYCLIRIGDYAAARTEALAGIRMGDSALTVPLRQIDSLIGQSAGP